jgi:hypothetical protein
MLVWGKRSWRMDAEGFRTLADRCRELLRIAVRDDVRRQLRQWIHDFEAEAEAAERPSRVAARSGDQ